MVRKLHIGIGLRRQRPTPLYPSEPGYVTQMRQQSKMLTDELLKIMDQFEDVSPEIMIEALQPTFEKAKEYTPKDTHALVNSAYLEATSFRGSPRVEMGFAKGGKPFYAVYVHEMTGIYHNPPTRAKFLEQALKEDIGDIFDRVAAGYKEFMNV